MRSEVCKLAKKMADEYGGRPADYMKDAWEIVKDGSNYQKETRVGRRKAQEEKTKGEKKVGFWGVALKTAGAYAGKKALEGSKKGVKASAKAAKNGAKRGARDLNFLKAPKDSPSEVLPDGIKDYLKDTFRLR